MTTSDRYSIPYDSINGRDTFPLPLAPMEQFWLWDDTLEFPKRFRLGMQWIGSIDWEKWDEALRLATARHPLLVALLDTGVGWNPGKNYPRWKIPEEPSIGVRWGEGDWQESPFSSKWDLRRESGLRLWGGEVGSSESRSRFLFILECHHAVCDGLGIRQFLADWMLIYNAMISVDAVSGIQKEAKLVRLDADRLHHRGVINRPTVTEESRPTTLWEKIRHAYGFHCLPPKTLAVRKKKPEYVPPYFRKVLLSADTTKSLMEAAKISSANLNDRAIAAMFMTVASWNRDHSKKPLRSQRLRVMIPTDLRSLSDMRMPAANRLGFGFVVASSKLCDNQQELLKTVTIQSRAIQLYRLGWDFVELFGLLAARPRIARFLFRIPQCFASASVTNLGDTTRRHRRNVDVDDGLPRCGDMWLEAIYGVPPIRLNTYVGIGVCRSGDALSISLILDGRRFEESDADELLARYVEKLTKSLL